MSAVVLKWPVPVDGQPHAIGGGDVLHVGVQLAVRDVCVWTLELEATPAPSRNVQVFATGEPVDVRHRHIGSVIWDPYVWHVFELRG
jgi:hypothetical protein